MEPFPMALFAWVVFYLSAPVAHQSVRQAVAARQMIKCEQDCVQGAVRQSNRGSRLAY